MKNMKSGATAEGRIPPAETVGYLRLADALALTPADAVSDHGQPLALADVSDCGHSTASRDGHLDSPAAVSVHGQPQRLLDALALMPADAAVSDHGQPLAANAWDGGVRDPLTVTSSRCSPDHG